jgi:hypothetical protein
MNNYLKYFIEKLGKKKKFQIIIFTFFKKKLL